MIFSSGCAGSSWGRQWGLAACILKPPCWVRPQPFLPFLVGCLSWGRRVPESDRNTVNWRKVRERRHSVVTELKRSHKCKKKTCSLSPQMTHASSHGRMQRFGSKLPNTLTVSFISSLPSTKVAQHQQQQKVPLSQTWQSAIFNPLKMIIEFALIPFHRRLPSNNPISTLVTSDPAPLPRACAAHFLQWGLARFWMVWHSSFRAPARSWNGTDKGQVLTQSFQNAHKLDQHAYLCG